MGTARLGDFGLMTMTDLSAIFLPNSGSVRRAVTGSRSTND